MVRLTVLEAAGRPVTGVAVELPRTHLAAVATPRGYVMCGALDVRLLDTRLADRGIMAARVLGAATPEQVLEARVDDMTEAARRAGVRRGMTGAKALALMW
jgi:uncharacterized protein YunC (DUF1805 family)